jgi:hypothetical protein
MKIMLIVFVSIILNCSALAEDKVSKDLAMEYLKTSKIDDVINASIAQYEIQLFGKSSQEQKENFHNLMVNTVGWDATKDQLAELVIQIYTREEIEASIAFMKSPIGASATAKYEEFSKQFANMLSRNVQKAIFQGSEQQN